MESSQSRIVNLYSFKEKLRARLPANSPLLSDLQLEPDTMPADGAAVLIPHYLRRLERELESYEVSGPAVLTRP
jgi:hypothetical protein